MSDERCQVRMYDGKPCNRESKRNGKCIFHFESKPIEEVESLSDVESIDQVLSHRMEELDRIEEEFWKELDRMEKDDKVKGLDFTKFVFHQFISFKNHVFKKDVFFCNAKFNNEADFRDAKLNRALFHNAKFNSIASFHNAEFNNMTVFSGADFFGIVDFKKTKFPSDSQKTNITLFRNVKFHKPKEVMFHNVDLCNVSFLNTDITKVEFLDEKWSRKERRFGSRNIVVDEMLIGKDKEVSLEAVAQLYRRLRKNYESNLRFAEAGDFFIGEIEMRRLNVNTRFKNKIVRNIILWLKRNFSLTAWYKHLSYYGESALYPTLWAFGTILFFSFINYLLLGRTEEGYLKGLTDSIATFFQLRMETAFDIFERLLSVPMLGLLFIALKRKFERRK